MNKNKKKFGSCFAAPINLSSVGAYICHDREPVSSLWLCTNMLSWYSLAAAINSIFSKYFSISLASSAGCK